MCRHITRAFLTIGIVLSACSGPSGDEGTESARTNAGRSAPAATDTSDSMQESDSMAMHAGHQDTAAAADADDSSEVAHAGHDPVATGTPAGDEHVGHAPTAGRQVATEHAQHAAAGRSQSRADTAHAAHAPQGAPRPDTAHAAHAVPRDTTRAAHAEPEAAAHAGHGATPVLETDAHEQMQGMMHRMWMRPLGAGWTLMGMAQAFPIVSTSLSADDDTSLDATELYLTQPAVMFNVESPGSRFTMRTTLNFEGLTQPDGELTSGGWGEGFLDKRHPHTLLHEFMLSANLWEVAGGALSMSAGKGFAPYGTDDPMSRPAVKYPTNHHLSQILERWTVSGAYINRGWSLEAAVFGGAEPVGPYDFSNIESFGDSWSARVARRFGAGYGPMAESELSASFGRVSEEHDGEAEITTLYNAAFRHERMYSFGTMYSLVEASMSEPEEDDGYFSVLGETRISLGAHQPYYRIEYATRPEYTREGAPGTKEFFRYDHDADAIGATRWLINVIGYGHELTGYPVSARPFLEVQHSRVSAERGGIDPQDLFGRRSFWGLTAGFRVFLGGDPMRMGSYGVLDAMTSMHRGASMAGPAADDAHQDHR